MRVRLIHIVPRRGGVKSRREEHVEVDALGIGRGTENGLQLDTLTVALDHAVLRQRGSVFHVEARDQNAVTVNDRPTASREIAFGDALRIANYELRLLPPQGDEDLVLEVERFERRRRDREDVAGRAELHLGLTPFTPLRLSWLSGIAALLLLGALPLGNAAFEFAWSSGPIARAHARIAEDCESCHAGDFQRVRDAACLECHADAADHAPEDVDLAALDALRCAGCHREHNGSIALVDQAQGACADCHAELSTHLRTAVQDAADFASAHPEFRVALVREPGAEPERVRFRDTLEERSGLVFDHVRHVAEEISHPRTDFRGTLSCDTCHVPEPTGRAMRPIGFERHCQECHSLAFDERAPEREAVHGDVPALRADLEEFYAARALAELEGRSAAPAARPSLRRGRPGASLTPVQREAARERARSDAESAVRFLMEDEGRCRLCHVVEGREVTPVNVVARWMPISHFSHRSHRSFGCDSCHPAERSAQAGDVLMPDRETCLDCHGGRASRAPRVASDCGMCHGFHRVARSGTEPGA